MQPNRLLSHSLFVILMLTIPLTNLAKDPDKKDKTSDNSPTVFYSSTQSEGFIGTTDVRPYDSPTDNIFEVILNEKPNAHSRVWLTYELFGVKDHASVSRSINDQLSVGGYYVKKSDQWTEQKEQIAADWLKEGKNIVRFTLPENAMYHYQIKNLGFLIQQSDQPSPALVLNQSTDKTYFDGKGYIKGYVTGDSKHKARVYIDGAEVQVIQSEFEGISVNKSNQDAWQSKVKVVYADGQSIEHQVQFENALEADHRNAHTSLRVMKVQKEFAPDEEMELFLHGAAIQLAAGSLEAKQEISITALRNIDIPAMDMGLVNVTKEYAGYRFLPHGTQFAKNVKVTLDYEPSKIPTGYTEKDIKTYYFDEETCHWVVLPKKRLLQDQQKLSSVTNHFTDMINGILMVPESPETGANTPTSIKDWQPASPDTYVTMMEAPEASVMGTAGMNYPIELPTGRGGVEPMLSLGYNNEGMNGWLGMGWDLSIPAVAIDTRWGVPRYDPAFETETYSIDGQQLSPVAHRSALVSRSAEKRFYPRIEEGFRRIIRHGNSPKNYWWEMTDKAGVRFFYGGRPEIGVDHTNILKDAFGNIAHWGLSEVRDLNDNFMRYNYVLVSDVGVANGSVSGYQLYIDHITYTGHGDVAGAYKVAFIRDKSLGEARRKDVKIEANLGLKQVTADLLRKIEVTFNGQPVRSYTLNYTQGAFFKTLLSSLQEFDAAGALFTTHEFDYYDDVREEGTYKPFTSQESWNPQSDNVKGSFISPIEFFGDEASAISGTKSTSFGGGVAVTIGPYDGDITAKSFTVGGQFGVSFSESEGMLSLMDINGDGLPDKVFSNGGGLSYRQNRSGPDGATTFGPVRPITGIDQFSESSTLSFNFGAQANIDPFFLGLDGSISTTTEKTYFSDVNGDGLMDIIDNGVAWFNHLDESGDPVFTQSSTDTPSEISQDFTIAGGLIEEDPEEQEFLIDQNPLHDVIRVWKAPFDGIVSVEGDVALLPGTGDNPDDGVRVTVQLAGTELWSTIIGPGDFVPKTPAGLGSVTVTAGDRLYFRVQSIENGLNDKVTWNPVVAYTDRPTGLFDANDQPLYSYTASEGFILTADQLVSAPMAGTIRIEGMFSKPQTSDDVTVSVFFNDAPVWEQDYTWDEEVDENITLDVVVQQGDALKFQVASNTNIRWTDLSWMPKVFYTAAADPSMQLTNGNGDPIIEFLPAVHYSIYPAQIQEGQESIWVALTDTMITLTPSLLIGSAVDEEGVPFDSDLTFSIKRANEMVEKQTVPVMGNMATAASMQVSALQGDTLFFEFHASVESMGLAKAITSSQAIVMGQPLDVALFTVEDVYSFGPLYRHWGQFAYNGNRERANQPINEADLDQFNQALQEDEVPDVAGIENLDDLQDLQNSGDFSDPNSSNLIVLAPSIEEQVWKGRDDFTFVTATEISSSRQGLDDLSGESAVVSGTGIRGVKRVTKNFGTSLAGGGGLGPVSGSISGGWNTATTQSEFMDMNGDSYPDIVTQGSIQYTFGSGALDPNPRSHGLEVHESVSAALGITLGGSYVKSKNSNTQTPNVGSSTSSQAKTNQKGGGAESDNATKQAILSVGLSGNGSLSNDVSEASWMDINGDGLPDKVYRNGDVALNLGYSFAAREPWGFEEIRQGLTVDFGAGLGINLKNGSLTAGVSLSRSENEANLALQDINGDGLADIVIKNSSLVDIAADHPLLSSIIDGPDISVVKDIFTSPGDIAEIVENLIEDPAASTLTVALNTGNGFADPILWDGGEYISKGASTGEGVNIAFTFCLTLIPPKPLAKLCVNPSGNGGQGASREWAQLSDINGDGYPDALYSEKDNELKVKRSTIGRTNMLRSVKRPLGGEIALDYQRVGNTYDLQRSTWVLSSVAIDDGVPGDGADISKNTFVYEGGYYDRNERQFFGFQRVMLNHIDTENNDQVYRTIIKEFNNDDYYQHGLPKSELLQDAQGKPFDGSTYTYLLQDVVSGNPLPASYVDNDEGAAFPALITETNEYYEGQNIPQKVTQTTYGYDAFGNVINYTDFADEGPEDDITAQVTYHSLPTPYIVGIPSSIVASNSGQIYRKRESDIDQTTGLTTQIRMYADENAASVYDMSYDALGNLSTVTRPQNDLGERLTYSYTYDDQVATYITQIADSYGYVSSAAYDYRFGQQLIATDMNGQQTLIGIDDVGRITSVRGPLEIASGQPYTILKEYYPDADIPWALTRHYDPANPVNDIETATFIDGLGREIQVKKDAAIFQQGADQEMMIVSGTTIYDAFGRTVAEYHPITESKGQTGIYNQGLDQVIPATASYDVLDRLLTGVLQDGATTIISYDFGLDRDGQTQFRTTSADANGIWMENYMDIEGDVTAIKRQYSQGQDTWVSFKYNPVNEQIAAIDDLGFETNSLFDWLGRRIYHSHPDAGITTYQYDRAGNVAEKRTANLQNTPNGIRYQYDRERLRGIIYPNNPQNNVSFEYGDTGMAFNGAGRIVLQEDASGSHEFLYNPLGAISRKTRTITVPGADPLVYTTDWTYDTWDRVSEMIYPDGEVLTYGYNAGGKLRNMIGIKDGSTFDYLVQKGYDKFEQCVFKQYGNNTTTSYGYEPERRRLSTLVAKTAKNRDMMDNAYAYDGLSNILRVTNNASRPASNLMGGGSDYQYTYDDLYRLTRAEGDHQGSNLEHRYTLDMTYNTVGGILSKNQVHERKAFNKKDWSTEVKNTYELDYAYGNTSAHAPSQIGDKSYSYDANGNQTNWEDDTNGQRREIVWDEENRIHTLTDNGDQFNYVYDAGGERVLKGKGQGQVSGGKTSGGGGIGNYTIYVNPYVVIRSGEMTKHFYVEGERIATKLGDSNEGLELDNTREKKSKNGNAIVVLNYYHSDHLGSASFLTDASGEVYQHTEYFAFGETFLQEQGNTEDNPYLFNGKELDEETGLYYYGDRYYDPITSVWQSVDPQAAKYPQLSPYNYVANNPLTFVDPDGQVIMLAPDLTDDEKNMIRNELQKVTGDFLLVHDSQLKVHKWDSKLYPKGTLLLRRLHESKNTVTIGIFRYVHKGPGNKHRALGMGRYNPGQGSDSYVQFDPTSDPGIKTLNPNNGITTRRKRPNHIGLTHELIHADRAMRGRSAPREDIVDHTYREKNEWVTQKVSLEEAATSGVNPSSFNRRADVHENNIRYEQGQRLRAAY